VAQRLGVGEEDILRALEAGQINARVVSLESSLSPNGSTFTIAECVGNCDAALEHYERYAGLRAALAALKERERSVLILYFFAQWSQARIARHLGLSQMHVSRLQKRALERLRAFPLGFD